VGPIKSSGVSPNRCAGDDIFSGSDGGDDTCIRVEAIDDSDCEHVTP
jgi:hypothetical protein